MAKKREDNLISLADRPEEERKAIQSAGGKASKEAQRKRKAMRQQIEALLSLPANSKKAVAKMKAMGIPEGDRDNQMQLIVAMFAKACTGDTYAAQFIRDTVGDKPTDKHSVELDTGLLDDVLTQLGGDDE